MQATHRDILANIAQKQDAMVNQLHQFCEINSGTDNILGLAVMASRLELAFKTVADTITFKPAPLLSQIDISGSLTTLHCGDALFISKRPQLKRRILLVGHMDTVYGANHGFQKLTYTDDNTLNGPGVADMKGGLVVMLQALSSFEESATASTLGWDVLLNADEEIGSPTTGKLLETLAPNYQAALVYEPAMTVTGTLARNRKGSGKVTIVAQGRAAHAGRSFLEGRNAICYLAQYLLEVDSLNGQREGVTINVGKIAGGDALNVVPDKAVAQLDVRISEESDEVWVHQALHNIQTKMQHPDYQLQIHEHFGRPVKKICPATQRLFQRLQQQAKQLKLTLDWQDSGGCCDGNNLAKHGLAVLDTLGVRGGAIHSPAEFVLLDSLTERAALSTLLLLDLAEGGLEDLYL